MVVKLEPDEILVLQKFKEVVGDLDQDDCVLIRFLRARDYDIHNAEELEWLEDIGIDKMEEWEIPSSYATDLNWRHYGRTHEGAPICWMIAGRSNLKAILDNGEYDSALRWAFVMMETGQKLMTECGVPGIVVIDMEDLTYGQATHIRSLRILYDGLLQFKRCYKEITRNIYVINAPWVFTIIWNFVKGIFSQKTRDKIHIYSSSSKAEWYAEFLTHMPRESRTCKA